MYTLQQYQMYLEKEDVGLKAVREACEADLITFIHYVHPHTVLGHVHEDVCNFWQGRDAFTHQGVLLPRDHQKSRMKAYETVWKITRDPIRRHLYLSATSNLAEKQLMFMKDILESDAHRKLWPFHILPDEGKRKKWTATEIYLDHPLRAEAAIRDPSIFAAGLTTGKTGLHFDQIDFDDVVVQENAYTKEGRKKVADQASLLVSILDGAEDACVKVVGTRYHPVDLYQTMADMMMEEFDDEGDPTGNMVPIYEWFEKAVEDRGDGFGEFLWPRIKLPNARKAYGFNAQTLAKKRAQYTNKTQYYAQYYNNPNDPDNEAIKAEWFQYYETVHLNCLYGKWSIGGKRLNLTAAIDFAYTTDTRSDYTALVIIGTDSDRNHYVLEVNAFKTDEVQTYYKNILAAKVKWNFHTLVAEVKGAALPIVNELRRYMQKQGNAVTIKEENPNSNDGDKASRIQAQLEPVYSALGVYHYRGGGCQLLEEQLKLVRPPHDDIKDAMAMAIKYAVPPASNTHHVNPRRKRKFNRQFGGFGS